MKVKILKVKDGIIEPLGDDMSACMCGCGGGGGSSLDLVCPTVCPPPAPVCPSPGCPCSASVCL